MKQKLFTKSLLVKLLSTLCLLILVNTFTFGQLENHTWYFGANGTGVKFDRITHQPSQHNIRPSQTTFGAEGCSVVSDPANGDIVFYTNGETVFDKNHQVILNNLGGDDQSAQPVTVCRVPSECYKYYVFLNRTYVRRPLAINDEFHLFQLRYRILDFSSGSLNASPIIDLNNAIRAGEATSLIPHANGRDFWLVGHNLTNSPTNPILDDFFVYLVTENGVYLEPQSATFNPIPTNQPNDYSYNMSYNDSIGEIAMTFRHGNIGTIKFDNATGQLSNFRTIEIVNQYPPVGERVLYDCEYSSNGKYLYFCTFNSRDNDILNNTYAGLFQINLATTSITQVYGRNTTGTGDPNGAGGLKLGPDKALYYLSHFGASASSGNNIVRVVNPDVLHSTNSLSPNFSTGTQIRSRNFPTTLVIPSVIIDCEPLSTKQVDIAPMWYSYPSLATDIINVEQSLNKDASLYLMNVNGRILREYNNVGQNFQIPISELTVGTYFLRLRSEEGENTRKFIKVK